MIEVKHLSKVFGDKKAVDNISFEVPKGKTMVLLGTSGSGKTTTLKMLNRLISPSSGEIIINDVNTNNVDAALLRRDIGYVIQSIGLFPHLTIGENIALVPELLKWEKGKINERIQFLIELLNLDEIRLSNYPAVLSGGQQQRIGLARALAADPAILLMDEPFGALDPITRSDIRREFINLEGILNKTVVIVTHDILEAWELADIICLMDEGRIIQIGNLHELTWFPATDFVSDFLSPYQSQLEGMTLKWSDLTPFLKADITLNSNLTYQSLSKKLEKEHDYETLLALQEAYIKFKRSLNGPK